MVSIEETIALLKEGKVVAIPTETVYGLAVRYDLQESIEALYALKGRPKQNPLTINLYEAKDIQPFIADQPEGLPLLIERYWPGPLTIVVKVKKESILPIVRDGGETCGFKVPSHEWTREILKEVGPLVIPSANLSGKPAATQASQIEKEFQGKVPILDGGESEIGIASTVVAFIENRWHVLREGSISKKDLKDVLGKEKVQ
jgi:L-threonylcarbamoyladenylate synthase